MSESNEIEWPTDMPPAVRQRVGATIRGAWEDLQVARSVISRES